MIKNELVLALSTEHMPARYPHFGFHIYIDNHFGYYVLVAKPNKSTPIWLRDIMLEAFNNKCKLIVFHQEEDIVPKFKTWDW